MSEHRSSDGFPVEVGAKFWNNDLRVCEIKEIGKQDTRPYSDTGEFQTWHKTNEGIFDTMSGRMRPYGRLARYFEGKNAEEFPVGTNYSEVK